MYYGPTAACIIVSPNMDRQWAFHAAATPVPNQKTYKVYPFLTGVTVTLKANLVSALQVSIDAPFEEGIAMLSEDDGGVSPFNTNNLIKVKIGYGDMNLWTPWYYGMLNEGGSGLSIGPEGISGTISAQMNNWQSGYVAENAGATAKTSQAFLEQLAGHMGMTLEIGPGAIEKLSQGDHLSHLTQFAYTISSFSKTNAEAFMSVCTMTGLYVLPTFKDDGKPDILMVYSIPEVSRGDAMAGKKRNTYVMRGAFSPQSQQYPILSWGPDPTLASWLGSTVRPSNSGIGMRGINKVTGNVVQLDVNPYDSEEPLGVGKVTQKGKAQNRSYKGKTLDKAIGFGLLTPEICTMSLTSKDDGTAALIMKIRGVSKMMDGNQAQTATLKSLGVPDQEMLEVVNVRGLSPRYDGPYKVMGATHTFAPGSYEMDLNVQRVGTLGSDEPEQNGTVGGQVPPA